MKGTLGVQMFAALCFAQEGSTWLCGPERFASLCLDLTGQRAAGAKVSFISTSITTCLVLTPVHSKARWGCLCGMLGMNWSSVLILQPPPTIVYLSYMRTAPLCAAQSKGTLLPLPPTFLESNVQSCLSKSTCRLARRLLGMNFFPECTGEKLWTLRLWGLSWTMGWQTS